MLWECQRFKLSGECKSLACALTKTVSPYFIRASLNSTVSLLVLHANGFESEVAYSVLVMSGKERNIVEG